MRKSKLNNDLGCSVPLLSCPATGRCVEESTHARKKLRKNEMESDARQLTTLLYQAPDDEAAQTEVYRLVEVRFRQMARRMFRDERSDHTLQGTVLVDDAFQQLVTARTQWKNREQFFAAAAKVMRRKLIDHARQKAAQKRGGDLRRIVLERHGDELPMNSSDPVDVLAIGEAVEKLEEKHPELFNVLNLHVYMGYELKEIADEILEVPYTFVQKQLTKAKLFLHRELFPARE